MGWKGNIRTIGAIARRMERDSIRRRKELDRQQVHFSKMQALEQAAYEVDVYNNFIDQLISLHKECTESIDWTGIAKRPPPSKPTRKSTNEECARELFDSYKPSIFDKLFKRIPKRRQELEDAIDLAVKKDEDIFNAKVDDYNKAQEEYADSLELANKIITGDLSAYKDAVEELRPYEELSGIGSKIAIQFNSPDRISISLHIHDDKVIPNKTKSLLSSGKLSIKDTPIGKYNEIYQDYVCSAAIRTAREFFAILPLTEVVVNAVGNCLNESTGRKEDRSILSVLFVKETMKTINFNLIDPSSAMSNFLHNMDFKKTRGFLPVKELTL